ncbi:MAG TPA: alpha/beta hydrolase, partial [Terriglobales bacterium]|nr:alpha/beta hydrolase [Terriglobales bacterium]
MPDDSILSLAPPVADERIAYGKGASQFGDLRLPRGKGPFPLAVNIHGGFWRARYDLAHSGHLCAALTKAGVATWNLEYRRVGQTGGGWPGTLQDVAAGFRFADKLAPQYKLDRSRVVLIGHSAGGQLALCLAARASRLRAVVALAPVCDLRRAWELKLGNGAVGDFLGGSPEEVPEHYLEASPMELAITVSQRIIHGAEDEVVPIELSRSYEKRKTERKEDVRLLEIAGAGHFELIDPRTAAWRKVESTVVGLLGI